MTIDTSTLAGIEGKIFDFVKGKLPYDSDVEITTSTPLFEGLLDSLGALQIASFLEESFGIRVIDGDLGPENFETVELLALYVERKVAKLRK